MLTEKDTRVTLFEDNGAPPRVFVLPSMEVFDYKAVEANTADFLHGKYDILHS